MAKRIWIRVGEMMWDVPNKNRPHSQVNPDKRISIEKQGNMWNVLILIKENEKYTETSKDFKTKKEALKFARAYMVKN